MSAAVLERHDPLAGLSREAFERRLRDALRGRVEEAWIFGSYAEGTFHSESDVDLFLVQATDLPFTRRPFAFADLLDIGPALDMLVYTPGEFARLTANPSIGFWRTAVARMRRLL